MTRFFVVGFTTKRKQNHGSVFECFPNYPQRTPLKTTNEEKTVIRFFCFVQP